VCWGTIQPPRAAAPGPQQHLARAKTRCCPAPNGSFARFGWVTLGEQNRVNSRECRRQSKVRPCATRKFVEEIMEENRDGQAEYIRQVLDAYRKTPGDHRNHPPSVPSPGRPTASTRCAGAFCSPPLRGSPKKREGRREPFPRPAFRERGARWTSAGASCHRAITPRKALESKFRVRDSNEKPGRAARCCGPQAYGGPAGKSREARPRPCCRETRAGSRSCGSSPPGARACRRRETGLSGTTWIGLVVRK